MERRTKAATQTGIYLLIVAAILVVANVISFGAYKRIDMTKNERFSLSKGSARLVRDGLDKDLQADVYVTRGLPKYDAFIQDLTDLLTEYERAGNHFKYTVIEAKTDDERKAAKEAGLQEATFGEGSKTGKDQALLSKGFMGIAFKYGSEKEAIPILSLFRPGIIVTYEDVGRAGDFLVRAVMAAIENRGAPPRQALDIPTLL